MKMRKRRGLITNSVEISSQMVSSLVIENQHHGIQGPDLQLSVRLWQVPYSSDLSVLIYKIIGVNEMVSFQAQDSIQ